MRKALKKQYPEYLTTGAVAEHCGVSKATVLHWIDKVRLVAFRLPGGHYRIHRDDFIQFLAEHRIPVRKQLFKKNHGGQTDD